MDDNNKDAIIIGLKRNIKRLEEENKGFGDQVKVNYAEIYKLCHSEPVEESVD